MGKKDMDKEKLMYLLSDMPNLLPMLVESVLNDSATDPHCSAIYASNMIKCYICIMKELGKELPYSDVKSFFNFHSFTSEEYHLFETSRLKESEYYRGVQY